MPPRHRIAAVRHLRPDRVVRTLEILGAGRTARTGTVVIPAVASIAESRVPSEVAPRDPGRRIRIRVPPVVRGPLPGRIDVRDILDSKPQPAGKPRAEVTLPIAPDGPLVDTARFEDPRTPGQFWYLPRYDRKTRDGRYEMALAPRGNGWALTVKLVPHAAKEVTDAGGGTPLPHDLHISLKYKRKLAKIETEDAIEFSEITTETPPEGPIVVAVAPLDTVEKRDAAFLALTTPSAMPVLEIVRTVQLAQRVNATSGRRWKRSFARDALFPQRFGPEIFEHANYQGAKQRLRAGRFDVGDLAIGNDTLSSIKVPPGWSVTVWAEAGFWGDTSTYTADVAYVGDLLNDRTSSIEVKGPSTAEPPSEPRYVEGAHALACSIDPFVVDKDLHPYVYGEVVPTTTTTAEPEPRIVEFEGKSFVYLQDPREKQCFFYLPDSFRLMRDPDPPRTPVMVVQLTPGERGLDDTIATLKFVAVAHTNQRRLDAAMDKLSPYLPDGETAIVLQPLTATNARFSLALPGAGIQYQPRPDAVVELGTGMLSDLVNLPFTQFSQLFDAMFSADAPLFSGLVTIGPSEAAYTVPFSGRLADLHGQVVDTSHEPHPESSGAILTLTNVIESPVTIGAIDVKLRYGEQLIDGVIPDLALPIQLASDANVPLLVKPASAPPADIKPQVVLTLDKVTVALDREALLESILVNDVVPETKLAIKVKAHKVMFDAAAADPLLSIIVHLENGGSVDLNESTLEGTAHVSTPLTTFLLEKADARAYRYKLEVIRKSSRKRDTEWRTDTVEILYPDPS